MLVARNSFVPLGSGAPPACYFSATQGNGKSAGARTFRAVLADSDDAFALAPRPTRIECCPCCTTAEEIAVLLSMPRKLLSANELQHYAASSMTTIASAHDLRYFTPRILELCHTGEMIWPDIEIVYDDLRRADWES
jgi:hypothetical protein